MLAFDEETPLELIKRLMPDVLIKGADYTPEGVVGGEVVRAAGGRVYLAALVDGQSTSNMVRQIRDTDAEADGRPPSPALQS